MKIIGQIPARHGSQRVPRKNLRRLNGQPLIAYAIAAAKAATTLSDVYVNSDSEEIGQLALAHGVKFYKRPAELGGDHIVQDTFSYDFIQHIKPDVLVMINPVSPLIEGTDIDAMVRHFLEQRLDSLIATRQEQVHACYQGAPINFDPSRLLARTQDLIPIELCAWSVCVWNASIFAAHYEQHGHAVFCGKLGFYPLNRFKALKISTEEDFLFAELLMKDKARWQHLDVVAHREPIAGTAVGAGTEPARPRRSKDVAMAMERGGTARRSRGRKR